MNGRLPHGAQRFVRIGNIRRDLDEELRFHFDQTIEDLMSEGYNAQDARDEAERRFGDQNRYRHDLESIDRGTERVRRWSERVDALRQMVHLAFRSIVRSPALTLGIILAFALGIGANATMFGIVDRLLLRPPSHIVDAGRVSHLYFESYWENMGKRVANGTISYPDYLDMKRAKSFSGVIASSGETITIGTGEDAERTNAAMVSDDFFKVLGTRPLAGRFFEPGTDRIGGPKEAVLSYGLWRRTYGGARDAIGKSIDFGYGPYTIVGVAPRGFTGITLEKTDLFLPIEAAAAQTQGTDWKDPIEGPNWQWLDVYARVADGVTFERAALEATTIHKAARAEAVKNGNWNKDPSVIVGSLIAAKGPDASNATLVTKLLAAVSLLVLLIACVNVANLLLARTIRQRREIAVRLALGISRFRLVGQIVLEGVMLALLGGAAALAVEHWGGGIVRTTLLPDVAWDDLGTDKRIVIAVAIMAVLAGILAAIIPAMQLMRRDVADTIRQATAGGLTRTTSRVRTSLALAQTALSVVLLVGAGLFVHSLQNVRNLDLGWDPDRLVYAYPRASNLNPIPTELKSQFMRDGARDIAALPGVASVAVSSTMPFRSMRSMPIKAEGVDSVRRPPSGGPYIHAVTPEYFNTMKLTILRGRSLNATDVEGAPRVMVMGKKMSEYLWPGQDPIGKCIFQIVNPRPAAGSRDALAAAPAAPPCIRVVGVAEDASNSSLREDLILQYYVPYAQSGNGRSDFWFIRLRGDDTETLRQIRGVIMKLDGRVRYAEAKLFEDVLQPQRQSWELGATMFGLFGILALIVASIGLYSVLSFDVAQRTRELGLRTALGATRQRLVGMIVARAVLVTVLGLLLGGVVSLLLAPRVRELLFDTSPYDPATFGLVGVTLLTVAVFAAAMPGWRATRVDPNVALRSE